MNADSQTQKERRSRAEQHGNIYNNVIRVVFTAIIVSCEIAIIYISFYYLNKQFVWLNYLLTAAATVTVVTVYARHLNSAYRMFWMIVIVANPLLGLICYALFGRRNVTRRMEKKYQKAHDRLDGMLTQHPEHPKVLRGMDADMAGCAVYLTRQKYPLYAGTEAYFFGDTNEALQAQIEELRKAKKFIFMEYFAIEMKESFQKVLAVLMEKAKEGVEVRIFYDEIGSSKNINRRFIDLMERCGIHCRVFNPIAPVFNVFMNNRDHRKITVIDGRVAFTGGYNLANEYFNISHPYGRWKDAGVMLRGKAAETFTFLFLENWNVTSKKPCPADENWEYLSFAGGEKPYHTKASSGFVQPFADSPLENERIGEEVYMNILRSAKKYVWITTPYLIITDEMRRELTGAAKRGVDVRIITPGIPDKIMVYQETRSYYQHLISGGVRIYEYRPGFLHEKMILSDDRMACVGTLNMDYRSFYLHFEDGVMFYGGPIIGQIRRDTEEILRVSEEVTSRYAREAQSLLLRMIRGFLRVIAPML